MPSPRDRLYTNDHDWLIQGEGPHLLGITDFAQDQLGEIVYVDLPDVGQSFEAGESFGEVESVKSVSELLLPVAGTIVEINEELADAPDMVNSDCYGDGWLIKFEQTDGDLAALMDSDAYDAFCSEL
jgi:glycine cleavage system H protein